MNRLLAQDRNDFMDCFPGAYEFLTAASLRYEASALLCNVRRTQWENNRLNELLGTPACKIEWFKKDILKD